MNYLHIIILCFVLFLILVFYKDTIQNSETLKINPSTNPIITYHKSGGIVGYLIRLEIYPDYTYKLFSHDKLVKIDKLNLVARASVSEILKNYLILEKIPKNKIDGNDYLYHSIDVNGRHFSLDADRSGEDEYVYIQLVNQNKKLFDSIKQLELLTNEQ